MKTSIRLVFAVMFCLTVVPRIARSQTSDTWLVPVVKSGTCPKKLQVVKGGGEHITVDVIIAGISESAKISTPAKKRRLKKKFGGGKEAVEAKLKQQFADCVATVKAPKDSPVEGVQLEFGQGELLVWFQTPDKRAVGIDVLEGNPRFDYWEASGD